jgi:uncharacterized protein (UPF0332 family)
MKNKTKPQQVNVKQVKLFLADAEKRSITARKNLAIDAEAAYQIAYEAMIKGSLALMLSHGQRPRHQLGHHIAIIEFAQKQFDASHTAIFILFDRMRRKRNDAFYDIGLISDTEAEEAVGTAETYLKLIAFAIRAKLP